MAPRGSGPADPARSGTTYHAGVDVEAGNAAVGRLAALARTTFGGGRDAPLAIGRFACGDRLPAGGDRLLATSADGVGTKPKLAFLLGGAFHSRVGADLVNHRVDDVAMG